MNYVAPMCVPASGVISQEEVIGEVIPALLSSLTPSASAPSQGVCVWGGEPMQQLRSRAVSAC